MRASLRKIVPASSLLGMASALSLTACSPLAGEKPIAPNARQPVLTVAVKSENNSPAEWLSPLIGLIGVAVGAGISELFRRRQRVEQFAGLVFAKRLEAYDNLWTLLQLGHSAVGEMLDDDTLSADERKEVVSAAVVSLAQFTDRHSLFLEEEVTVHCCTIFMGADEIPDLVEPEKATRLALYQRHWRLTRELVMESSGMARINRTFGSINKPRYKFPVVDYFRKLRAEQRKADRAG